MIKLSSPCYTTSQFSLQSPNPINYDRPDGNLLLAKDKVEKVKDCNFRSSFILEIHWNLVRLENEGIWWLMGEKFWMRKVIWDDRTVMKWDKRIKRSHM